MITTQAFASSTTGAIICIGSKYERVAMSVCVLRRASSDAQRKELEQRVIFELGMLHPGGINMDFSAFIQN